MRDFSLDWDLTSCNAQSVEFSPAWKLSPKQAFLFFSKFLHYIEPVSDYRIFFKAMNHKFCIIML